MLWAPDGRSYLQWKQFKPRLRSIRRCTKMMGSIYVIDQLKSDESDEVSWFDNIALKELLQKLPEKHRRVLVLRFFQDKTQTEVAKIIGLSQVQVSRIERQALAGIRQLLEADNKENTGEIS